MKGNRTSSLRSGPGRIWPLADLANVRSPGRASTFASDPFRSFSVSIISWNVHADVETRCKSVAGDALPTGSPGRLSDTQNGDDMKFALAAAMALIGCLVGFNSANAQGAAMKTTPTTKILAIGTINPGFEQSQVFAVLPEEVRETVDLYLDGKIEQWYSLQGKPGVALIINVTDPAVAHEMLEKLPLGKAHMMSFELIPIGPLNPLRFLQGMQPKP